MTSRTIDIRCKSCRKYCYSTLDISDADMKYVCKACKEGEMTPWFTPTTKPVRVGVYELCVYDAGWTYEWCAWWDGQMWRSDETGWALMDQQQTWRGLTEPSLMDRVDHIDDAGYVHWKTTK